MAENYQEAIKNKYILAYDTSIKSTKKYIGFETKKEAVDYIKDCKSSNFYEVIKRSNR